MSSEAQPFFSSSKGSYLPEDATPLYLEEKDTKRTKVILGVTLGFVAFTLTLCEILAIVQAIRVTNLFALLIISLLFFAQVQIFVVLFIYRGIVPKSYFWTIFVVAAFICIQSISTVVICFTLNLQS
ncbi:hypothetical protein EMCRGX_G006524 [Ephydatia muelleri]|eukprot:Em0002g1866a